MKNYYSLISKKLFSVYVVYTLLFTLVAYSATFIYSRNDYTKNEQKRIEQLTSGLESHLSSGLDIAAILSRHDSILKYSQSVDSIDTAVAARVRDDIASPLLLNRIYSGVAVINIPQKHVVMPGGTLSYSFFKDSFGLTDTDIDTDLDMLYSANKNRSILLTANTEISGGQRRPLIACLVACPTSSEKPIVYAFIYDLGELFKSIPAGSIAASVELSMNKDGMFVAYSESDPERVSYTEGGSHRFLKKVAETNIYSNYWGDIHGVFCVPLFSYFSHLNSSFLLLFLLLTIVAFVGYSFIRTNLTAMYSPIKDLTSMLPPDFSNGSDDLGAFENYVSSLVSQKNIMTDIISETKIELGDKFLINLMTKTLSKAQVTDGIITYGLSDVPFPTVCFIITYRDYRELQNLLSTDGLNEVRVTIHNILDESFRTRAFFKLIDIDAQTIAAVSSMDKGEDFAALLKKAALNIEMMLDIDLVFFMGNPAFSWYEVCDSYSSAMSSKNNYMIISDRNIVITPDSEKNSSVTFSTADENELISAVTNADMNKAVDCINRIVDRNTQDTSLTHEQFSSFAIMLYSTIVKLLSSIGKTETELFGDVRIYLELIGCSDAETLKSTMTYFIAAIIQSVTNTRKHIADNVANRTLSYVEDNYNRDISLFTLADYLNVSQSYASRIFKQQTGENFKDYLTNVRLKKAVELMQENPYIKIADVAKRVGYTSVSLTRAFTKKYGKAPSDYQKEIQGR